MTALYLPKRIRTEMLAHAQLTGPNECVGLLFGHQTRAGHEAHVTRRVSVPNLSATPETHYFAAPERVLAALQEADERGDVLVGLYHSHPRGPGLPSPTDLAEARYNVPYLIVLPATGELWAYGLSKTGYESVALLETP